MAISAMTLPSLGRLRNPLALFSRASPSPPSPETPPKGSTPIVALPHELQLLIIEHLAFADMERLRRTCQLYRSIITRDLVWSIFAPDLRATLLSHCYICLRHDPSRSLLICPDQLDPRYPLASRCVDCVSRRDEFAAGRKVALGNFSTAWVCRWCGFPVSADDCPRETQEFHDECYSRFNMSVFAYCVFGILQAACSVVGPALCWATYRARVPVILALTVVAFLLGIPCFALIMWRGRTTRTYHISCAFEAAVLAMWAGTLYEIIHQQYPLAPDVGVHLAPQMFSVVLAFTVLNLAFRLGNTLGNLVLASDTAIWRRKQTGMGPFGRTRYALALGLIAWTYPQSMQQEYPGRRACWAFCGGRYVV